MPSGRDLRHTPLFSHLLPLRAIPAMISTIYRRKQDLLASGLHKLPSSNHKLAAFNDCLAPINHSLASFNDCVAPFIHSLPSFNDSLASFNNCVAPFTHSLPSFNDPVASFSDCLPSFNDSLASFNHSPVRSNPRPTPFLHLPTNRRPSNAPTLTLSLSLPEGRGDQIPDPFSTFLGEKVRMRGHSVDHHFPSNPNNP